MKTNTNIGVSELLGNSMWLMEPRAFKSMLERLRASVEANAAVLTAPVVAGPVKPRIIGTAAVIDVTGPITYKATWFSMLFGGATIESLRTQFQAALADPAVKTVVFRFDSPGGTVEMVPEFAAEVAAARGTKPIVAVTDTLAASAAYWIAAQCDTIYVSASSVVGSIGVYTYHEDVSELLKTMGVKVTFVYHGENKVAGNSYQPLDDATKADIQQRVDEIGAEFDKAVAKGRGVSVGAVLEKFGQGRVFRGKKAIELGLADKAGTALQVIGKMSGTENRMMTRAEMLSATAISADGEEEPTDGPELEPCEQCDANCQCKQSASGPCDAGCESCAESGKGCACQATASDGEDEAATLALLLC